MNGYIAMDEQVTTATTPTGKRQAPMLSVSEALASSRTNLRTIEELLFGSDPRSPAGLLLCQFGLVVARLQVGIPIGRDAVLSLLAAASKVACGVRAP